MGCDIHAYIETIRSGRGGDHAYLWAKTDYDRSYWLFSLLAKVRGGTLTDELGFEPKGIPENISYQVSQEYFFTVDDKRARQYEDGERFCSAETAEKYASYGSQLIPSHTREDGYVFPAKVSNPDWHSASWLSLEELQEVVKRWKALPQWFTTSDISQVRVEEGVTEEQLKERLASRKPPKRFWKSEILGLRDGWAMYRYTYKQRREPISRDLLATIGAMKALKTKNIEPRLVFWFDN